MKKIREQLIALSEPDYQAFTSKLLPGTKNILGVRLPFLRKMAKQLAKEDWRGFLAEASDDFHEEIMLQGMVIGFASVSFEEIKRYIEKFVPKIDNWSVCDSFCSGLKITKQYPHEMWNLLQGYLSDTREFYVRFGVVMLLNYYISEEYVREALQIMDKISNEAYYVKMGVAWTISMYYVKLPEETMDYLKNNQLDDFTYNKALQKITESLKVDKETKALIRAMKRK